MCVSLDNSFPSVRQESTLGPWKGPLSCNTSTSSVSFCHSFFCLVCLIIQRTHKIPFESAALTEHPPCLWICVHVICISSFYISCGSAHGPTSFQPKSIDHYYMLGSLKRRDNTDTGNGIDTSMSCPWAIETPLVTADSSQWWLSAPICLRSFSGLDGEEGAVPGHCIPGATLSQPGIEVGEQTCLH